MSTKKELISELNKKSKAELKKLCGKQIKLPAGAGKKEIITKLETLDKKKLEVILGLKKESKEEKVIEISLKPNKWMIPAVGLTALIIILVAMQYAPSATTTSNALLTYIIDSDCSECYDVTINEMILRDSYGVNTTIKSYDYRSTEGIALINKYMITKIPAFIVTGDSLASNELLMSVWESVGTIEADGALVFRAPEALSTSYKVMGANGTFSMYIPPETTIGNFMIMEDEVCTEEGKLAVYFFGSTSCPHCIWEKPIIAEVASLFNDSIVYFENMGTQDNLDVFYNYMDLNQGSVPFIVIGCQYVRVGSGESLILYNETLIELNDSTLFTKQEELLSLRDEIISAYEVNNTALADSLIANYSTLVQDSSEEVEKQVLIKLICNLTNNEPSVC